ncbi:polyprotein [Paris polyphylla severe chlorotic mottle virus]|nr:polyprotein [Paris polyphylla severe chlorotic mottle virus]
MAFTYRNPLEQAINNLPSKYSDQILSKTADHIMEKIDDLNSLFAFSMKKETESLLVAAGIEMAPLCFNVHSHPVCKTIENHILYRVLMNAVKKLPSIALVSMREEKEKKFIKRRNFSSFGKIQHLGAFNACIDWKDRYRYINPSEFPFCHEQVLHRYRDECTTNGWFPKTIFLHDELHFWNPEDVLRLFSIVPETGSLLATLVCPIELLTGDDTSRNPRIYTFEKSGENFHYFPDGVPSEGYRQNIETTTWPLKYCTITGNGISLRVSILYSLFSHHLVSFERGCIPQNEIFLAKPEAILSSELSIISNKLVNSTIERSVMSSILLYLSCLKNPNKESALAKLRQLEKRDLFPDEAFLVSSLSSSFMKHGFNNELEGGFLSKVVDFSLDLLPSFLGVLISKDKVWQLAFRNFAREIAVKHIRIKRKTLEVDDEELVVEPACFIGDRSPRPYSLKPVVQLGLASIFLPKTLGRPGLVQPLDFSRTHINLGFLSTLYRKAQKIKNTKPLFLTLKPHTDFILENASETFSSDGVVLPDFMNPNLDVIPVDDIRKKKNACVILAIASFLEVDPNILYKQVMSFDISPELMDLLLDDAPLPLSVFNEIGICLDVHILCELNGIIRQFNTQGSLMVGINLVNGHATACSKKTFNETYKKQIFINKKNVGSRSARLVCPNTTSVPIDIKRALELAKSLFRGSTGILRSTSDSSCLVLEKYIKCLSALQEKGFHANFTCGITTGAPGSGKTVSIRKQLLNEPSCLSAIVSPRRALAEDWSAQLKGTLHQVYTFEAALFKINKNVKRLVLDEISLYPQGYLDLIVLMIAIRKSSKGEFSLDSPNSLASSFKESYINTFEVSIVGDPLQNFYYSDIDSSILNHEHCFTKVLKCLKEPLNYSWYSHRLPAGFNSILDIPCLGSGSFCKPRFFADSTAIKCTDYSAVLTASQDDKKNINFSLAPMTFGESQGLTFKSKVLILLSDDILRTSSNSLLVAITRSSVGFDFLLGGTHSLLEFKKFSEKKLLGYVLSGKQIPRDRVTASIPCKDVNLIEAFGSLEDKASNDVFILPEVQPSFPMPEGINTEEVEILPSWFKCHVPIISVNPLFSEVFEKMEAKEKREFWHTSVGSSEQFSDTDKGLVSSSMGLGFRFSSIFPRHSGDDSVTFWEGVKKRLTFSNPRDERAKLDASREWAPRLVDHFLSKLPDRFSITNEDIEMGLNSFNDKRELKSEALWKNHAERSDIDWPLNHVLLFMKSQLCTKEEKMFSNAKAGQTLACFHHTILFRMGPTLRAIERAFLRACGESYYIHSGKNFFALNEFLLQNAQIMDGRSLESDYEAFDSCQDSTILAFESELLKRLGVSSSFIADYEALKLNLGCRLGSMAIMRFTGEFCTFLFNTFANMLFTFLKYDIKKERDRLLFAGDDMCSLGHLRPNTDPSALLLKEFRLKAKETVTPKPMFCGWFLTPFGVLKSPRLLWSRLCVMHERGLLHNCLDSYFLEAVFSYNLGERLYLILSDEELDYHYAVTRFFIQNKCKLVGDARRAAYGSLEVFGSTCQSLRSMNSSYEATPPSSRLTPSGVQTSMVTPHSFDPIYSTAYDGLSRTSKLWVLARIALLFQTSNYLIRRSWSSLNANLEPSTTYMLAQFSLPSPHSSQTPPSRLVMWCFMMGRLLIRETDISRVINFLSRPGQHSLLYDLDIAFLALIHIYATVSEWCWTFLELHTCKGVKSYRLMLELCTALQILPDSLQTRTGALAGLNRQSGAPNFWNSMAPRWSYWNTAPPQCRLRCSIRGSFGVTEVSFFRRKLPALGGIVPTTHPQKTWKHLKVMGSFLSQLLCVLKINIMSTAEAVIHSNFRTIVTNFLWITYIDPTNVFWPVLAEGAQRPAAQQTMRRTFQQPYMEMLFGNIAILGSSIKTQWPDVDIQLPPITFNRLGLNHTLNVTMNLATVVNSITTHQAGHADANYSRATLRQICEVFAKEARTFLKTNNDRGIQTNIYKKFPRALEPAAWVAFDFCSGLNMKDIGPEERKVVDRLTKRLFRTEGQKAVFEAGAEVNDIIEG